MNNMNLNHNPTSVELRALMDACETGAGMQVLWVESFGEVQVALMLAETHGEWLKGMNGQVLFEYDSKNKKDRNRDGSEVDDLYIVTLFERLMQDWGTREQRPPMPVDEKADLVILRMRARENKYWFEALTLAEFQMQTQLNALLGLREKTVAKNRVETLAAPTLTRNLISRELHDRIHEFAIHRNEMVHGFLNAAIPYGQLEPIVNQSDGLIHELSQIPLAA